MYSAAKTVAVCFTMSTFLHIVNLDNLPNEKQSPQLNTFSTSATHFMCHFCPLPTADPVQDKLVCRQNFDDLEARFNGLFKLASKYEDDYRNIGLRYHSTQLAARRTSDLSQDALAKLRNLYETSRVEEYNAIFGELHDIVQSAANLRDTYLHRYHGPAADVYHRGMYIVFPGLKDLRSRLQAFGNETRDRVSDVRTLSDISRATYETDAQGRLQAWSLPAESGNSPRPRSMGEEWRTFRAWVWSLPETQCSVQLGRTVDEVALGLLYQSEEEHLQ
jgi:hypothetical protein